MRNARTKKAKILYCYHLLFFTARKMSKYRIISGPNTGKYRPEITLYLDTSCSAYLWH